MEGEDDDQEKEVENAPFECKKSNENRVRCQLFWKFWNGVSFVENRV